MARNNERLWTVPSFKESLLAATSGSLTAREYAPWNQSTDKVEVARYHRHWGGPFRGKAAVGLGTFEGTKDHFLSCSARLLASNVPPKQTIRPLSSDSLVPTPLVHEDWREMLTPPQFQSVKADTPCGTNCSTMPRQTSAVPSTSPRVERSRQGRTAQSGSRALASAIDASVDVSDLCKEDRYTSTYKMDFQTVEPQAYEPILRKPTMDMSLRYKRGGHRIALFPDISRTA